MNLFKQTLLSLCGLTIYVVSLFFLAPQAVGESEDQDKLQKEVRARLVFDVAKGFFIVNNFSSAISRLEDFSRLYSDSPLLAEAMRHTRKL